MLKITQSVATIPAQDIKRARQFYEARGFIASEFTDGSRNEEREPDVLYVWRAGKA